MTRKWELGIGNEVLCNLEAHPVTTGPHCQKTVYTLGRRDGNSLAVFYQPLLPTPAPQLGCSSLREPGKGVSQPEHRWETLAPRRVLWQPSCLLTALHLSSWGWHFYPLAHQCKKPAGCLQRVGKLHLGGFCCLPKTREEKDPGSQLASGAVVGCDEEDKRLTCSPPPFVFLSGGFEVHMLVHCFSAYLLSGGLPSCQCLTKSACHYFIFWNPKMLKCFHGKQNVFNNCSSEFGKVSLFSPSLSFQQDACLCSFFFSSFSVV